jgi:hypothetical protein
MDQSERYENFPLSIVLVCNLVPISLYVIGALILSGFGLWMTVLYLVLCLGLEYRVMRASCVNCYYYGRWCGFGKGKLCSLLFKKGDPQRFANRHITWRDLLSDFLVVLVPLVGGVVLLIQDFSWLLVIALAVFVGLAFGGTGYIRGSIVCKHCKQRDIGCPAAQFFSQARQH